MIVSKTKIGYANNTYISKSNMAASGWGDKEDNHIKHMQDTMAGGRKINDRDLVLKMTQEAAGQVAFLRDCGVDLATEKDRLRIRHVPGHSYPRHVSGANWIGRDLVLPLKARAKAMGVEFFEKVFITTLHASDGMIRGASGLTETGELITFSAKCVILATGGFSRIYSHTNNAPGITGDGQVLAFRLGVPLKDMEFVQFYPTALGRYGNRLLLYESLIFHAGAVLKNAEGERILEKHGLTEQKLATRDRLAQAIMKEILDSRGSQDAMIMDLGEISEDNALTMAPLLPGSFMDGKRAFAVSPTTHFTMGGVTIDTDAETAISGLFAAGEVCAGIHGANRLGGNALAEVFAMGSVAGKAAAKRAKILGRRPVNLDDVEGERKRINGLFSEKGADIRRNSRRLKQIMWLNAGIVRQEKGLEKAIQSIGALKKDSCEYAITDIGGLFRYLELENMFCISEIVCRSARLRKESRGSHYRVDYPEENDRKWQCNIKVWLKEGEMVIEKSPLSPWIETKKS